MIYYGDKMAEIIWTGLFTPLASFLLLLIFGGYFNRKTVGFIGCASIFIAFLCFFTLFHRYDTLDLQPINLTLYNWIPVENIQAKFALRIDPLSLLMTLIITGIGFLIHVYSNGYIEHDKDYARFFACMNFFIFAMLILVLASDILLLFVGWEGVGLASYLLIGYWYEKPSAAQAATKAFVVNRIGDLGFLLGILLTFTLFHTGDIAEISRQAAQNYPVGSQIITILTLLYFVGAVGKSAQIPLHTWLPDAMEGPTPVSALIHAATMVTAGVYLVVRMHSVFMLSPITLNTIGVIGGVTSLFAALCATSQFDLKRVLAYSTISQLGLMFLACGVGAYYAAMFHLTTHAFVKALLFLSAGNVVHMLDETDMGKMGGLAKKFPVTHWLFLIGALALSGIPPLSAFFSKDLILEQEYLTGFKTLFFIGLATSILTGFYLIRAYVIAFWDKPQTEIPATVHEAPKIMLAPLLILAFLAIAGGFIGFSFGKEAFLEGFLAEVGITLAEPEANNAFIYSPETAISIFGALSAIALAVWLYSRYDLKLYVPLFRNGFYFNEFYWNFFALPLKNFAQLITNFFEPKIFEGLITSTANATQNIATTLQRMQSGQIRSYVAWMAVGMGFLVLYFLWP